MGPSARAIAEQASLQAFLNGYLLEVDAGQWFSADEWQEDPAVSPAGTHLCVLPLPNQRTRLTVDVLYHSATGRHQFGRLRLWQPGRLSWVTLEPLHAMTLLVRELFSLIGGMLPELRKSRELELLHRLTDSYQTMARYLLARQPDDRLHSNRFIDTEQSQLFGHPSHPTPKSRQGMADWQHQTYAPELAGGFQLHYFLVREDWITQDSDGPMPATAMAEAILGAGQAALHLPADVRLVPAHPLQAQWLLLQPDIHEAIQTGCIQPLGPLGPLFRATSSVRTLYCESADWMLKFSIPVRVTNSLRVNQRHELCAGVAMSRLLRRLEVPGVTGVNDAAQTPVFSVLRDPAYLSVSLPGKCESGFEMIFRDNPFPPRNDRGITAVAALTQDPLPGRSSRLFDLIEGLALNENRSLAAVSRDWFAHYLHCAVAPALRLYDDHGIALEAHQQNSLLDVSSGYPSRYIYRDNQGYYLSESRRPALISLCPELEALPELFYRDAMICERFCYYLIVNQVFGVIARFGRDKLLDETALMGQLRRFLVTLARDCHGPAVPLIGLLLADSRLPFKGNLLTRAHDIDELTAELELAVYTSIPNPLHPGRAQQPAQDRTSARSFGNGAA
ncbi:MAG: IucA/IucC family protein [Pseudomonadota bacterium]|nr:IucA/IucC family protein [Pseudomonadota bacterium]